MAVHIEKAKINDGRLVVKYRMAVDGGGKDELDRNCTTQVHEDIIKAFALLDVHLGLICEQFDMT